MKATLTIAILCAWPFVAMRVLILATMGGGWTYITLAVWMVPLQIQLTEAILTRTAGSRCERNVQGITYKTTPADHRRSS